MLILIALLFTAVYGESRCTPARREWTTACPYTDVPTYCELYYTWNVNPSTADYSDQPTKCTFNYATQKCVKGTEVCTPQCHLFSGTGSSAYYKTGGPNGWVCSNFNNQADCAKSYVDDYGDRWCFWKNGKCNTGRECYN